MLFNLGRKSRPSPRVFSVHTCARLDTGVDPKIRCCHPAVGFKIKGLRLRRVRPKPSKGQTLRPDLSLPAGDERAIPNPGVSRWAKPGRCRRRWAPGSCSCGGGGGTSPSGGGDPCEESTAPCAAGRRAAARWFLEVEAAELGGAVSFLAGDDCDDAASTGR
jgi:hypothetical protein